MTQGDLFRSLLINEEDIKREIEAKAREVFMLDMQGGVVFKIPKRELNHKQLIGVYLLAHYIAHELGITDQPTMTADLIATASGLDVKTVRARLADLKKEGVTSSPDRGLYIVTLMGASGVLDEILNKGDN